MITWTQMLVLPDQPGPPVGTETAAPPAVLAGGTARAPRPPEGAAPGCHHPWAPLAVQAITTLRALPTPG
ncbi:hypothetical protein FRAHR75_1190002 [Frankia sp. Hr75.2]|nr:hypothetical protein FRAHR75_1190002 [Frankia sp. Hr75.2]